MQSVEFDDYNICLIDVNQIIRDNGVFIINQINSFGIELCLSKHVVKKLFHSFIIHQLCEITIKCKTNNKIVLYYNKEDKNFGWLNDFFDKQLLAKFFLSSLKMYSKVFPLRIFTGKVTLQYVQKELQENNEDIKVMLTEIKKLTENTKIKNYWFKKSKQFVEKYELKFLSRDYFTTIKSKQISYK